MVKPLIAKKCDDICNKPT